jgi:hypothetical protein
MAAVAFSRAGNQINRGLLSIRLARARHSDPSRHKIQWRFPIAIRRSRERDIDVVAGALEKRLQSSPALWRLLWSCQSGAGHAGGFGFSIVALPLLEQPNITATRVKWDEALEGSAKELLDDAAPKESGGTKQEMAEGFLRTAIKTGEKRAPEDVTKEAKECGISGATLRRAKAAAKVVSVQAKDRWWWTRE